jgi:hypothetical protein
MVIISIISNGSAARISDRIGDIWGSQIQSFLVTWKVEDTVAEERVSYDSNSRRNYFEV